MEEETVALEANASVRHEVNHISVDANGQSNLEQPEMQQQDLDMSNRGTSPEEEEEEATTDKKTVIVNGHQSDGLVNYGFMDLEEENELASHKDFSSYKDEDVDESGDGEGGTTVRTTFVTTITKHVGGPTARIEDLDSLNEEDEHEEENYMEGLSYSRNDKHETGEPLQEDSPVVIEKKAVTHHTEYITVDGFSSESKTFIEDNVTVEVENFPVLIPLYNTSESAQNFQEKDEKDPIEDDSPNVVEKRPTSLHMEVVLDEGEGKDVIESTIKGSPEMTEKRPGSVQEEQVLNEKGNTEIREPIEEASVVAQESEARLFHYHSMLEENVEEVGEDKEVDVDNIKIERESIVMEPEQRQETDTERTTETADTRNDIVKESPFVVEKRPVSLDIEPGFDHEENQDTREEIMETIVDVIEKRPVLRNMEQVFHEEDSSKIQKQIEEDSAVAIEKEPRLLEYHPILEENVAEETVSCKGVDDISVDVENLSVLKELEKPRKTTAEQILRPPETREEIAEEELLVVEKRPVSLHLEAALDHEESGEVRRTIEEVYPEVIERRPISFHMEHIFHDEGRTERQEPIEEASAVAVEAESRLRHYHPMLEENVEEIEEAKNIDDISVEVNGGSVVSEPEKGQETATEIREDIAEEKPLVVEESPVSLLHLEASFDHEESSEVGQTIEEISPEVIERRPVSSHFEYLFHNDEPTEEQELKEEASAVAVESEPRLLQYHPMLEENVEEVEEVKNMDDISLEVNVESVVMVPDKGQETTADTTTEYSESRQVVREESPFVIEKRPVSLHMEAALEHDESHEARKTIEEASPEVIEKGHVSLHIEQVLREEESSEVREPIEEASAVAVESEPRKFYYHSMLEEKSDELAENKHDDDSSMEVGFELVTIEPEKGQEKETEETTKLSDTRASIAEEPPLIVERRPVSPHSNTAFDQEERPDVMRPIEETSPQIVEKRPVSLNMEYVFHEEESTEVEEASATAVESEPRSFSYHPMLEQKVEAPVENESDDEISIDLAWEPKKEDIEAEETTASFETREVIAEDSPTVMEKRPVSLHMDTMFDHDDGENVRMPIEEASSEIIEKKPVSLNTEHVFHEEESAEGREPIEEASAVVVESESRFFHYHPMLEEKEEELEDKNVDDRSLEFATEPQEGDKIQNEQTTEMREAIAEESPLVIQKRPVSLHTEAVFDHGEDHAVKEAPSIRIQKGPTELDEPVAEAELVVIQKKTASPQLNVLFEQGSSDDELIGDTKGEDDASVESLLNNIESIIEKPSSGQTESKEMELISPSDKEPIEEDLPVRVEKRVASPNLESLIGPEIFRGRIEAYPVEQEKREIVDEVVTDVVLKKPVSCALYDKQETETEETESVDKETPSSVIVLDIPQQEKKKEGDDFVQETAAPVVEKKASEFNHELFKPVDTKEQKPNEFDVDHSQRETNDDVQETKHTEVITTTRSVLTSEQITGEQPTQESETIVTKTVYETKTVEVTSSSTNSLPNTITTEETFSSTSYMKQFHEGDMDGEGDLVRYVLKKRLSAPEVLPEKESEGSAPLATSESRGILESREQFHLVEKDSTAPSTTQSSDKSGVEPYEDVPDDERLILDSTVDAEVPVADSMEKEEGADQTLPVLVLLTPEDEGKQKKRKRGKKGELSSPQCKCCSLM